LEERGGEGGKVLPSAETVDGRKGGKKKRKRKKRAVNFLHREGKRAGGKERKELCLNRLQEKKKGERGNVLHDDPQGMGGD